MSKIVYLDAPNVGALEKKYLARAVDSNYVSTVGPFVPEFEDKFARYLRIKKAVSTQSGTAAIHLALHELGIGRGDEVIVPALTFIATVNPVTYVGAKPVFADVDIETWSIDPKDVEKKITSKTKAIICVHLYGNPCDMGALCGLAKRHDLRLIEDATESLGATYRGRHTGTLGDFGCFSFNGNKIITTGGGGVIAGKDVRSLGHVKFLVNQARDNMDGYHHREVGFNYRMTNIEAAIGLAQMERLGGFLKKKRAFGSIYRQELKKLKFVRFQEKYPGAEPSQWLTSITIDRDVDIQALQKRLKTEGIQTRRIFKPVTAFPPYEGRGGMREKNSYAIYGKGLSLPGSTLNTVSSVEKAAVSIRKAISNI